MVGTLMPIRGHDPSPYSLGTTDNVGVQLSEVDEPIASGYKPTLRESLKRNTVVNIHTPS